VIRGYRQRRLSNVDDGQTETVQRQRATRPLTSQTTIDPQGDKFTGPQYNRNSEALADAEEDNADAAADNNALKRKQRVLFFYRSEFSFTRFIFIGAPSLPNKIRIKF